MAEPCHSAYLLLILLSPEASTLCKCFLQVIHKNCCFLLLPPVLPESGKNGTGLLVAFVKLSLHSKMLNQPMTAPYLQRSSHKIRHSTQKNVLCPSEPNCCNGQLSGTAVLTMANSSHNYWHQGISQTVWAESVPVSCLQGCQSERARRCRSILGPAGR